MTSFLIFFLWPNFVAIGIERIKLSTASLPEGFALASIILPLVDVDGSTFATAPNKFVTFSSGTLVFVSTKFDQRKKIKKLVKDKRN